MKRAKKITNWVYGIGVVLLTLRLVAAKLYFRWEEEQGIVRLPTGTNWEELDFKLGLIILTVIFLLVRGVLGNLQKRREEENHFRGQ